ncbi:LacI family DNA-binding transcriptional regulator [Synoicihabitans lomoniglobus]|uniref:LacI family DNA-binding transcriptional regulator n=1 Tax=Synoicihabitans lomoniglobus TaxID=2909285 RepID=A0AAF0CHF2_9BACT|nr:LacI family transcriptional regulator [Opitutaceae bacterium LMO-M01]WED64247.1 LacI family DNA-binding transcriptional regulator [Opitutaceae bacterium LMO-M01]
MPNPTLRTLAKELGLSRTTVSDALRGSPRVKAKTIERVRAAADAAGYQRNPLTGTVMSLLRRSGGQEFRGVIGIIDFVPEDRSPHAQRYADAVVAGIDRRADELGFKAERFEVGPKGMHLKRLDTIMHTRGIQALIILPAVGFPDLTALNWNRYTAVYTDYFIDRPGLHCVCSDHYRSMVALLNETHRRGYRRPGLYMEIPLDERLQFRWEGAFVALQKYLPDITEVPPLRLAKISKKEFLIWFKKHNPDVVFGHDSDALQWMKEAGARVPETHSYVCLNSLRAQTGCTALDFQSGQLGARSAELVTAQLLHNELGVPREPSLTTLPALLVEGNTLAKVKPTVAATTKKKAAPRKRQTATAK